MVQKSRDTITQRSCWGKADRTVNVPEMRIRFLHVVFEANAVLCTQKWLYKMLNSARSAFGRVLARANQPQVA